MADLYRAIATEVPTLDDPCFTGTPDGRAAADLLRGMLAKRPSERLRLADVRTSRFYDGFSWDAFHAQAMPPPFVPSRDPRLPTPR